MYDQGMMPLFYYPDSETAFAVMKACYAGGVRLMEYTNRGDFAHEIFGELNKFAAKEMPDMILGVGSVVDAGTASLYIQLGSNFIVSPTLVPEMAKVCNRRKILWGPGCATLSEISLAEELGAEIVKIFPAPSLGGPDFIKAVKGPCPWTSIMPTGGVSPTRENLSEWFGAGAACVGMGSQLITSDILKRKAYGELEQKCRDTLALIRDIRGQG